MEDEKKKRDIEKLQTNGEEWKRGTETEKEKACAYKKDFKTGKMEQEKKK